MESQYVTEENVTEWIEKERDKSSLWLTPGTSAPEQPELKYETLLLPPHIHTGVGGENCS